MRKKYKIVANIVINEWGPPPAIAVEGHSPDQKIRRGEAVAILLPNIRNNKGNLMPRLSIDLVVKRKKDEGTLRDFVFLAQTNMQGYKDFWDKRKSEVEIGVFLP